MKNNLVLIQQASGDHRHLLTLTQPFHNLYCQQRGYDYWCIHGTQSIPDIEFPTHPFWEKVYLIQQALLADYQYIVWLDADTLILPNTDLMQAITPHKIAMVWNEKTEIETHFEMYAHHNCGAVYIERYWDTITFIKEWFNTDDEGHCWGDQHALRNCIREWGDKGNGCPVVSIDRRWNSTPFNPSPDPAVLAWHGYGNLDERLSAMREAVRTHWLERPRQVSASSPEDAFEQGYKAELQGDVDSALILYTEALRADWQIPTAKRCASMLAAKHEWESASFLIEKIVDIDPKDGEAWRMLTGCYIFLGNHQQSIVANQMAQRYHGGNPGTHVNNALIQLKSGNWKEGWEEDRWQFVQGGRQMRHFSPEWDGKRVYCDNPTHKLFVWCEQGFGDTIMMSRFAKQLSDCTSDLKETLVLEVQPALVELYKAQEWQNVEIIEKTGIHSSVLPDFDAHIGILSLPRVLGITPENVSGEPYLKAPHHKMTHWRTKLKGTKGLKVGFVFQGSTDNANDVNRSIPPEMFSDLTDTPGCTFFCLQKGEVMEGIPEAAKAQCSNVHFVGHELKDFADTAGLLANLDLVICVDTSVAHLAGAMGIKTWVLVSKSSDWRWLTDRDDTVWYKQMRLFSQEVLGEWEPVIANLQDALIRLLCKNEPEPSSIGFHGGSNV